MVPNSVKLYYIFRPFIPRDLQIFFRRRLAKIQRRLNKNCWPVDQVSATPPDGWSGWPDGKQFTFILSHDVDTQQGYEDTLKLAEVEESLGFRSTFNFVPERYGEISMDLIKELKARGFGIGVHGLKHDGKLFFSKKTFQRRAVKINDYLKKWGSRGFSSPSMHHNLSWLKSLNIDYSVSTFDTDPFEPQPDGAGTIFPYWVSNGNSKRGHLEIPYTLPQDSTLYIILQEDTNNIWKNKLKWICGHGGMALINTHPDYMDFSMGKTDKEKYPIEHYTDFLEAFELMRSGQSGKVILDWSE